MPPFGFGTGLEERVCSREVEEEGKRELTTDGSGRTYLNKRCAIHAVAVGRCHDHEKSVCRRRVSKGWC